MGSDLDEAEQLAAAWPWWPPCAAAKLEVGAEGGVELGEEELLGGLGEAAPDLEVRVVASHPTPHTNPHLRNGPM